VLVVITVRKAADLARHNARQKRGGGRVRGDSVADGSLPGPGLDAFAGADPTFAAWLQDEADDPVGAEAMRWMLRTGKRPEHLLPGSKRWQQCGPE
jgi:hypothetical protein